MTLSLDALTVLIILLPGFLCAALVRWLCVRPQQTELDKVIEALLFSFLVYVTYSLRFGKLTTIDNRSLVWLTVLSVTLSGLFAILWTNDWVGTLLRKLRVTHRTSRPSVWLDTFHHYGGYVLVEMGDGRMITGCVKYYSDLAEHPTLFLMDAAWISRTGRELRIKGPGILINEQCKIKTISFHRAEDTLLKRDTQITTTGGLVNE